MTREVVLSGPRAVRLGAVALVDDEDYPRVAQYSWHAFAVHGDESRLYAVRGLRIDGRHTTQRMHAFVVGYPRPDHIDGNGLNNQRSNLRPATAVQNLANSGSRRGPTSRFKGVSWYALNGTWQVHIKTGGKSRYLGRFADEREAALVYDAAALAAWGEFARLNFPEVDHA